VAEPVPPAPVLPDGEHLLSYDEDPHLDAAIIGGGRILLLGWAVALIVAGLAFFPLIAAFGVFAGGLFAFGAGVLAFALYLWGAPVAVRLLRIRG